MSSTACGLAGGALAGSARGSADEHASPADSAAASGECGEQRARHRAGTLGIRAGLAVKGP